MSAADDTFRMLAGLIEAARIVPDSLRAAPRSLPLTVIGGFLGAGKTTLVNRLLAGPHGLRIAVLVNDFGRINVDAALLVSRTAETIALTNGCACCSIAGDLTRALVRVAQGESPPQAIVLEASGIADPRSLAQVALANPAVRLDGVVTLVDAETVDAHAQDPGHGSLFRSQVAAADLVVLNKRDLVDAVHFEAARAWVATHAPGRPIVEAQHADVPLDILLGLESRRSLDGAPADRGHEKLFRTRTVHGDTPMDERQILDLLGEGGAEVLRAKGFVWLTSALERRTLFQRVGARHTFVPGAPWDGETPRSEVVVISRSRR